MPKRKSSDGNAQPQECVAKRSRLSPGPHLANSTKAKSTLRISNIPRSLTEDKFLRTLNDLPCDIPPEESRQNVLKWSFTPAAASADAERSKTATVSFRSVPTELQSESSIDLFQDESTVTADSNFYGLTPLYCPPEQPIADIVAVTGLAGHAFGSWKSRKSQDGDVMWLRDFLPEHAPNARILTYGYDSTLLDNNSNASLPEFSQNFLEALKTARANDMEKKRPLVLIGHSLGGLVIKQAILKAAQNVGDDEYRSIFDSCHALVFFGVPNKGLQDANWGSMVKGQPNSRLVSNLEEPSDFLHLLHESWVSNKPKEIRVVSIYETKPTGVVQQTSAGWERSGPEVLMVSKDSAILATSAENQGDIFSIDANHSNIVKFDSKTCQNYLNVRSRIINLVQDAHAKTQEMKAYTRFEGCDEEKKRSKILKWLSQIEYKRHHENAKEDLLENTGQWLLVKQQFYKWRFSEASGILWLHGIPGAGKTKLTCMVIDCLKSPPQNGGGHQRYEPVVYFYCNRNEPRRQSPVAILQAIIKQLSTVHPDPTLLPKPVVGKYTKRVQDGLALGSLTFNECYELIVLLLGMYPKTTIIIDALDESDPKERWRLLEVLETIVKFSPSLVKIFISSRDDIEITLELKNVPNLYIKAGDNGGDIARFVDREVARSIGNSSLLCGYVSKELKNHIISTIVSKANGMFQWANLQIKHLLEMGSENDIRENLGKLPENLEATYAQIYKAICSERPHARNYAIKALKWIMCSRKLLSREEWSGVSYWPEKVPENGVHLLFKLCRNLVAWDRQPNAVGFAHLSVREYLESQITSAGANSMAAEFCLLVFDPKYWPGDEVQSLSQPTKAIVEYSTFCWPHHLSSCYSNDENISRNLLCRVQSFLGTSTEPGQAYCKWFQSAKRNNFGAVPFLESTPLNPLFACSYFGFGEGFQQLWERNSFDINQTNNKGQALLFVASMQGNEWVVNMLLQKGAEIRVGETENACSPLVAAIDGRHSKIAAMLFDISADTENHHHKKAFQYAAEWWDSTMMLAIMGRGVNTKITEEVVGAAAKNWQYGEEVVKLLLARKPDVKITEVVIVAAVKNYYYGEGIMELLLARELDVEITEAVLVAGAEKDYYGEEIMELLLAREPDVEITEAVLVAAAGNSEEIVELLLARKPDMEITEAVLVAAAGCGFCGKEVMELLLARKPDVKITEAVLKAAVGNWNYGEEVAELILDKEPNIEITEAVLEAATRNRFSGDKVMGLLLATNPTSKSPKRL